MVTDQSGLISLDDEEGGSRSDLLVDFTVFNLLWGVSAWLRGTAAAKCVCVCL